MDFLTASIFSGLLYDGVKEGAKITTSLCKSVLQGWIVDDDVISQVVCKLQDSGISEDLNQRAIEKKICENDLLLDLISKIPAAPITSSVSQSSHIGSNVIGHEKSKITIGNIILNKE